MDGVTDWKIFEPQKAKMKKLMTLIACLFVVGCECAGGHNGNVSVDKHSVPWASQPLIPNPHNRFPRRHPAFPPFPLDPFPDGFIPPDLDGD
jgi:hypothetical protein